MKDLSIAAQRYNEETRRTLGFSHAVNGTATALQALADNMQELLRLLARPDQLDVTRLEASVIELAKIGNRIDASTPFIAELLFARLMDNFMMYLSDLLVLIFTKRPEILASSKDKVTYEQIFEYDTLDDLRAALTEQKVMELSFLGMAKLHTHLKKQHHFTLFPDETDLEQFVELIEQRNILIHNRGIVNQIYLTRVRNPSFKLHDHFTITIPKLVELAKMMAVTVGRIDVDAQAKFGPL